MKVNYKSYSDEVLTELLILGDDRAYAEIFDRHWAELYNFGRKWLRNEQDAEDIVQEAFTSLYLKKEQIYKDARAYLFQSIRYLIIDHARHQKVKESHILSFKDYFNRGEYVTDNQVRLNELKRQIEKAISELPPKMRAVFELSRKKYYSYKKIAEVTETSEETVRSQVSKALKILRSKVGMFTMFQIMQAILWINRTH